MDLTQIDHFDNATSSFCTETDHRPDPPLKLEHTGWLAGIHAPADLRSQPKHVLPEICAELRQELINQVSTSGGHFGANLGVIELTVALHFVFDTPRDKLIWDVGHQSYPHKILTGRRERMAGVRQLGGLSGFPVMSESEYDAFGTAHAGNSISAGLGMATAIARSQSYDEPAPRVVCVLGDGALTEGMVFEALNHGGATNENLLIVLNDNQMSISPNVGALTNAGGEHYERFFTSLGVQYNGPVDGHDINQLTESLKATQQHHGVQVLHVLTQKGKGYEAAEREPVAYHAVPVFDPATGVCKAKKPSKQTYTSVFGAWACDAAEADSRVTLITPAMKEGSGLVEFERRFKSQFHDVAIAEQHAVTFAAGLACENQKPVVAIYSSFLQRAYDQVIHDVALQNLDVLFAIDRSGLVGNDGATHHGSFDASFLRCVPNLIAMAPADERECRQMLQTGLEYPGPAAVRFERGSGCGAVPEETLDTLPIGQANIVRKGRGTAILAFGSMVHSALMAADTLGATLVNMRFIKPIDEQILVQLAADHDTFITVENNVVSGGAGSAVNEALNRLCVFKPVLNLGLPDSFVGHGTQQELLRECQLDTQGIAEQIKQFIKTVDTARYANSSATANITDKLKYQLAN
jgi:1-deoxy-D-xylulose-5-phosphate synthase